MAWVARYRCCLLAALALSCAVQADANPSRRVLMLQSADRGILVFDRFTLDFRAAIEKQSKEPVTVTEFVVAPAGFTEAPAAPIVTYLNSAFVGQARPELIVTVGAAATTFARRYRQQLFPQTPIIYALVDTRILANATLDANETAVTTTGNFTLLLEDILRLLPATKHVFVITGSGPVGQFWRQELAHDFRKYEPQLDFTWSDDLTYSQTRQRAADLPPNSAIMFISAGTFAQGGWSGTDHAISEISTAASAPFFGVHAVWLGLGTVGGSLMFIERVGALASEAAVRILAGEPPASIKATAIEQGPAAFDARQLRRWNIPESRLPAGSEVRFREAGVWERFGSIIVAGVSILLAQTALIGALLVNRRQRQRAEVALREHVVTLDAARAGLSQLSGRLLHAQEEERTRLARELHDDIAQRMAVVLIDLSRGLHTLPEGATKAREWARALQHALAELSDDIRNISHGLHNSKLEFLGLSAAAASFCKEISNQHALEVSFVHENVRRDLPKGVAISLFRVLQEAVSNAAKHAGATHCRVTLRGSADALHLEVLDDGHGFDPRSVATGHGLGLVSMQERLKLVNGVVTVESAPGQGTSVRARVPLTPNPTADAGAKG